MQSNVHSRPSIPPTPKTPTPHQTMVNLLYSNRKDAEVTEHACYALSSICALNAANQKKADEIRAFHPVIDALQEHADAPGVQAKGLQAVRAFCFKYPEAKSKLGAGGAIERVVAALDSFRDNKEVAEAASAALGALTMDQYNQSRAGRLEAVSSVVLVLRRARAGPGDLLCEACAPLINCRREALPGTFR